MNEMTEIKVEQGRLDEKMKNLENRISGVEMRIDQKLQKIEDKMADNNRSSEQRLEKIEAKINDSKKQTEQQLHIIDEKVDSIIELQSQLKGGWKTLSFVVSGILVFAGFVAFMTDKWDLIKSTFFG